MVLGLIPAVSATASPSLGIRETDWDGSSFEVYSDFESTLKVQYNFTSRVSFYYGTESNNQLLSGITDVTVADPSVLEVDSPEITPNGEHIYYFNGKKIGSTTLSVKTTSGTYTMPVEVHYPHMGIYTQPVRDLKYFVEDEFPFSASNNIFYFFTSDANFQISKCYVNDSDFEDNFKITPNGSYATVEIVDFTDLDGAHPHFRCEGTTTTPNGFSGFGSGYVTFVDGAEAIGYVDTWYDNDQLTYNDYFYKQLDLDMGNSTRIAFGYGNSANYNLLTNVVDVTSEDEDIATVELRDEDGKVKIWRIQSESLGSTFLNVETSSGTYRMPINVEMPRLGMYSQPNRKAEYLISREFLYSNSNSSFYLIFEDRDRTISDAWVENSDFVSNFAFTTVNPNCIRVDIVDPDGINGEWINFRCQLADSSGNPSGFGTYGTGIEFINNNPSIGFSSIRWQGDEIVSQNRFQSDFSFGPGGNVGMVFYYGTANNHSLLNNITSVTTADPSIATAAYWRDTVDGLPTYEVNFHNVGSTELIVRTADNQEYRAPLTVRIYGGYFFTKPQFDTQYVSTSFDITETNNTFYFVTEPGTIVNKLIPHKDFSDVFEISYAKDNSYATIKVVKPEKLPGWGMSMDAELSNSYGNTWTNGYALQVNNAIPTLGIKFASWDNNVVEPWSDFRSNFSDGFGSSPCVVFYYGTAANHTALTNITSITVADPALASVSYWTDTTDGAPCYEVTFHRPGTTEITVKTGDGNQYTIPLSINLYDVWAFGQDSFHPDYAIRAFELTDKQDIFYIVTRPGQTLTALDIESEFAGAFTVTQPSPTTYAIQVTDPSKLPESYYRIEFHAFGDNGQDTFDEFIYLPIHNELPSAGIRWAWWENDELDGRSDFITSISQRLGTQPFVPCYGTFSNNSPILNISSIESEDPSLFTLYTQGTTVSGGTVCVVEATDPFRTGTANMVINTTDGKTYKVPVTILVPLAYAYDSLSSTTPEFDFTFTDSWDTLYIKPTDPSMTIQGIRLDSAYDAFSVFCAPDGSSASITQVDPTKHLSPIKVFVEVELIGPMGRETAPLYPTLSNGVTPPVMPAAPVAPTAYPTWSHSGDGAPNDLSEGDQLHVSVPVENKTSADLTVNAMLAIYNDSGKMLALRSGTITIPANGSDDVSLDIDLTGIHNADHAKLFMTDSDFLPVSTVFTLS